MVIMLTYGPAMRIARLLARNALPVCSPTSSPVPA